MTIHEEQRDLFTVPQGYYLAHCISADFALGAGIAKKFDEVYNMKFKLFKNYDDNYDNFEFDGGEALLIDNVFNYDFDSQYYNLNYEKLQSYQKGANCLHAHAGASLGHSSLRNDEIVIYKEDQCTIKYLVEIGND